MTIKGITLFKLAVICPDWHLLVQNCIICLIMVRMNHFNHFKAIKEVSFQTKRCLWFKNDFNRFNRTKSLWGPFSHLAWDSEPATAPAHSRREDQTTKTKFDLYWIWWVLAGCGTFPLRNNSATYSFETILMFSFSMVLDFWPPESFVLLDVSFHQPSDRHIATTEISHRQ